MRKHRAGRFTNQKCECGKPAVVKSANSMACERCAELTSERDVQTTCGVPDRNPEHVGWTLIRAACIRRLAVAGISMQFQ